jgi:hypothetical protein
LNVIQKAFGINDKNKETPERKALESMIKQQSAPLAPAQAPMGMGGIPTGPQLNPQAARIMASQPQTMQPSFQAQQMGMMHDLGIGGKPPTGDAELRALVALSPKPTNKPEVKSLQLSDGSTIAAQYDPMKKSWTDMAGNAIPPQKLAGASLAREGKKVIVANAKGEPVIAFTKDGKVYDQKGQVIEDAKEYIKPPVMQPKAGVGDGKNTFATLTPDGWKDTNTGQMLKKFTPIPTFAQTGLYEPVTSWDTESGTFTAGIFDRRTGSTHVTASTGAFPPAIVSEITKAINPALEADTRYRVMNDNVGPALKGDQQAQLSLVANHIGMTLGQQKGARINQAVWNEAVASAPWIETIYAKWFHTDPGTGDHIFDGYKSGVNLTGRQIDQMRDLATERRSRQWQQATQTAKFYGVPLNVNVDEKTGITTPSSRPKGATIIVPGDDGKMHYSDGKKDLGVVPDGQ